MFEIEDVTSQKSGGESDKPAQGSSERPGIPIEPRRIIWEVLRLRRWIAISTLVGAALGVAAALRWAPREFAVTSILTWDSTAVHGDGRDPQRELRTLVDSVKTPAVILAVRAKLKLNAGIDSIGHQIEVATDDKSNMITLTAVSKSAKDALALCQTTLEAFQAQRLISEKQQRDATAKLLGARLETAKQALTELRLQNQTFLKEAQVTDLQAELAQALADSVRYVQEQVSAGADVAAEQARIDALSADLERRSPTVVLSEKAVRPDGAKLADIETELAGLRGGGLSEDHPRIKMLEAQAKSLREHGGDSWTNSVITERNSGRNPEIANFQNRIIEATAAREAAAGREKALGQLVTEANARVERLREVDRRGGDLTRSLAAAEAHVADLDALHFQALDAARTPISGLSLLEAPALPVMPRRSLRKPYAIAGVVLGAIFGFVSLLAFSLRGLKIHTSTELAFWGNGPVLISSQWPRHNLIGELRDELAAQSEGVAGGILLVPAGTAELEMLKELAHFSGWPSQEEAAFDAPLRLWLNEPSGHVLRKAVRQVARVIIVYGAGEHSLLHISELPMRIGSPSQLGYLLVNVTDELVVLPERVGDVRGFWHPGSDSPRLRVVGGV